MPAPWRIRRRLTAGIAASLAAMIVAPGAGAATYSTSVSPNPFSYPGTELKYRLHVKTGAQAERLGVFVPSVDVPSFSGEGQAVQIGRMTLEGPGSVVSENFGFGHGDRFCQPALPDTHGSFEFQSPSIEVVVPANSESALVLPGRPYEGLGRAPFLRMDLSVGFTVKADGQSAGRFFTPSPVNNGRHGVSIGLFVSQPNAPTIEPAASQRRPYCPSAYKLIPFGTDVVLSGRADPEIAGQNMAIQIVRRTSERESPRDLASVPVSEGGNFSFTWRPTEPGDYTLGALYRSQDPKFTDDFSDPISFRIAAPPGETAPPNETAPNETAPNETAPNETAPNETAPNDGRTAFRRGALTSRATARCLRGACAGAGTGLRGSVYRVTVRGRHRDQPCAGAVWLTYRLRGTRPITRRAKVGTSCRLRKTITFRTSRRTRPGMTLRIGQRFLGTKTVNPGQGRTLKIRLDRR